MNDLFITDAVPDDVYAIRKVQKETWLATYPNEELGISQEDIMMRFAVDDTEDGKQLMEERKRRISDPSSHIYVAKNNNNIIGFCIAKKEDYSGRIMAIYILPNFQGKGIGKMLIEKAFLWLGYDKNVFVNAASYNDKAISFYEKMGFEKTGKDVTDRSDPLPSGAIIPEIELVKKAQG